MRNNSKGDVHEKLLKSYGEPSWNNPALRILDENGKAVVPRLYGDWSPGRTVETLVAALAKRGVAAPAWLRALREELRAERRGWKTAVFGMT